MRPTRRDDTSRQSSGAEHCPSDFDADLPPADRILLIILMLATAGALTLVGIAWLTSQL